MKEPAGLLHTLLDKYENSALYKGTPQCNRRVWLHFNRRNLPRYYDDTSARHKQSINEAALLLESRGLIDIVWEKFEEGNLISKIALRADRLPQAYAFLSRRPRKDKENRLARLARDYAVGAVAWVRDFLIFTAEQLESGASVARYLDINEPERAEALFRVMVAAGVLDEEVPRRIFSQRVLGSTKAFDAVAGAAARVTADFHPRFAGSGKESEAHDQIETGEVLAELGIVDNPQHIFVSGGLQFSVGGRQLDVCLFRPDLGISTQMVGDMKVTAVPADYVITIENLAAFYSFIRANRGDYLAVYLGGYHNSLRRSFLLKIKDFVEASGQRTRFLHWGDIDYGGFSIFTHLRDNCLPELQPIFMDLDTLEKYRHYCLPVNERYAAWLRRLLENEKNRVFHPVVSYMLEQGIRLEQECVDPVLSL